MRHFKNVFELYRLDWRRIFKNPFATALIIALLIIPSLYAWFNIAALWDPYSNTSELKIAVYSADQTADFEDTSINIGDKLIDSLHDNHSLGWVFVKSKAELDKGVKDGTYYAGIYIPKSFSSDLLSFVKGDLKKPKIAIVSTIFCMLSFKRISFILSSLILVFYFTFGRISNISIYIYYIN